MVKIFELIKFGKEKLENCDTPQLDAEVILSHLLNKDRMYLYINREEVTDKDIIDKFNSMIERRRNGVPIQYITGHKEFMGLDFTVEPGVLIPRPDTEILVEEVINRITDIDNPIIVDVGCGSGAISVSIAKYANNPLVYALDIMDTPIKITNINAQKHGVADRVRVIKSDVFSSLPSEIKKDIDVIISNPPYIEKKVIPELMREVREYEPYEALSGGEDGLYFYREITKSAPEILRNKGLLAFEIGYNQKVEVMEILKSNGFSNIDCIKDLAGNDRVVIGYLI